MDVAQLSREVSTDGGEVEWSTTSNAKSVVMPKSDALPKMACQADQYIVLRKKTMVLSYLVIVYDAITCTESARTRDRELLRLAPECNSPINIAGMRNISIFRSALFSTRGLISCATSLTKANAASFSELSFADLLELATSWSRNILPHPQHCIGISGESVKFRRCY